MKSDIKLLINVYKSYFTYHKFDTWLVISLISSYRYQTIFLSKWYRKDTDTKTYIPRYPYLVWQ